MSPSNALGFLSATPQGRAKDMVLFDHAIAHPQNDSTERTALPQRAM